jgi:hypothetical protein
MKKSNSAKEATALNFSDSGRKSEEARPLKKQIISGNEAIALGFTASGRVSPLGGREPPDPRVAWSQ